ncbi:MAG: DEAD/DEAH box helicase [Burkholderiales bacterium]|nr:DEAD/DEAH box helicase [Burkholderiales bacterium]
MSESLQNTPDHTSGPDNAIVQGDAPAATAAAPSVAAENAFGALGLSSELLRAVTDAGYDQPTPVQARAIPAVIDGQDLMVCSQTGSGKTAAFLLPAIERMQRNPRQGAARGPRLLVLSPTRELATQITKAAEQFIEPFRRMRVVSILGGMPYRVQNAMLAKPYEILVATPGRLIDQLERGRIDLSGVEMLVLDEADRMLDMGFIEPVEAIAAATPSARQTLLFSATLEGRVAGLARNLLRDPQRIEISTPQTRHDNIAQHIIRADDMAHKNKLMRHILLQPDVTQAVVFLATKRDCDRIAQELGDEGFSVAAMHGDMEQRSRNWTLNQLRQGRVQVLVATDVAARGIDVPGLSHVINYDLPRAAEDYVHRIGRTGRAGARGTAISFAGPADGVVIKRIERYIDRKVEALIIPGLESRRPMRDGPGDGPGRKPGFGPKRHGAPGAGRGGFGGGGGRPAGGGGARTGGEGRSFGGGRTSGDGRAAGGRGGDGRGKTHR